MGAALTGNDIYSYFISGAKNLIAYEDYLNKINVFPVADGDTGTNLAFTMRHMIREAKAYEAVDATLKSLSENALAAAYGNSGTIISSYFHGVSQRSHGKATLSEAEFVSVLNDSVTDAYASVSTPKEGTILTVMRAWGAFITEHQPHHAKLTDLFKDSIEYAQQTLEQTKDLLKELREANIVDAGGKGFIYFIEGIYDFLCSGKMDVHPERVEPLVDIHVEQDLAYRYCTEFTFEPMTLVEKVTLEDFLLKQGDSVIINGYEGYFKIHLHTNDPEKSALFLQKYGKIVHTKVDDMLIQYAIANHRKHPIGLITDSIADVPASLLLEHQITVIPIQMIIDGATYVDRVTLRSDNTYGLIEAAKVYPTSSQPAENDILKTLTYLTKQFDQVIGIFISSKMSGTYEKVKRLVQENDLSQVSVVDSKVNSGAEGIVVRAAYTAIAEGLKVEQVLEKVDQAIQQVRIFVKIPDLSYATKSGRVPKAVGFIAKIFKLKVIISIDPEGEGTVTKHRSLKKTVLGIRDTKGISDYVIVHSSAPDQANKVANEFAESLGYPPLYVENVSAVIAAFIGKGAVGIAFLETKV